MDDIECVSQFNTNQPTENTNNLVITSLQKVDNVFLHASRYIFTRI